MGRVSKIYYVVDKFELCVDFWEDQSFSTEVGAFKSIVEK
jgi:hypothetical protein